LKLHYLTLSLLTCSCAIAMQTNNDSKKQRMQWTQEVNTINTQLRTGECTPELFTRKKQLTQQIIASYKKEIIGDNNNK